MNDTTSLLFGLDGYGVLDVEDIGDDAVRVVIEPLDSECACPGCGVISSRVKDRPLRRIKDLPASGRRVELWCRQRRLACLEQACPRRSFTLTTGQVPPRARVTGRLRGKLASSIARSNRAVSDVAAEFGVSWTTAHRALIAHAARWLPAPEPTRVLGIDETRARSVRWLKQDAGWKRSDPWMTSFVNADPAVPGRLLGLVPGRSGACVKGWLALQDKGFRDGIEVAVIDPSAPYASGIRAALPDAEIAVDHWHLVKLGNDMVTEVRQRVSRERHGRRGRKNDQAWAHRRLLLTAGDRLSARQLDRLQAMLAEDDPTNEIGAAWGCKERLRMLLASPADPWVLRARLWAFYRDCAAADMPETTRLAATIETWWPHILVALRHGVTNARTEGFNRIIKQVKRAGCGYRNMDNYERRILTHIALNRAA
jgi:transposase